MNLKKEIDEAKNKLQNLTQEIQMLEQAKQEKTILAIKIQGQIEILSRLYAPGGNYNCLLIGQKCPIGYKIRFTIQSLVAEGSSKNIPFEYFYWNLSNVDE